MHSMGSSYALTLHLRGTKIAPIWKKQQHIPLPPYRKYSLETWAPANNLRVCQKLKFILFATKSSKKREELEAAPPNGLEPKGTVAGAVALIIGTSIGSGILALPRKTSNAVLLSFLKTIVLVIQGISIQLTEAGHQGLIVFLQPYLQGFVPSALTMVICWAFLLVEALLLAEINVGLMKKKGKRKEKEEEAMEVEFISIRSMAQETLGEVGGSLAVVNYIFMSYVSMVAYTSKSGEILSPLIHLPTSITGAFFAVTSTALITVGGTCHTDRVNQWMTATMIVLLIAIEALGATAGVWSGLATTWNWDRIPLTIPVIIFSLVYNDIVPVICSYLGGNLPRIRLSVVIGSLVPLLAMLIWDALALGMATSSDGTDPLDLLSRVGSGEVLAMVEAFSLLAVGTSLIGTILGFSKFLMEELGALSTNFPIKTSQNETIRRNRFMNLREWWGINKVNLTATTLVIAPPLLVSNSVPDAFYTATDIAGGYCMVLLYGVLPPAMAWSMYHSPGNDQEEKLHEKVEEEIGGGGSLLSCKPALLVAGLFACGIVLEQIIQDISLLRS